MFFPIGWPRALNVHESEKICSITCNRDKILFGLLAVDAISIWCCKPCVPIVFQRRTQDSLQKYGENTMLEWRPDSSMLVIATNENYLLFYTLQIKADEVNLPYQQNDVPTSTLKRDSAELFIKDFIPSIRLSFDKSVWVDEGISAFVCIRDELMITTKTSFVIRYKWNGTQNRDYSLDLTRIPFSIDQQISTPATPLTNRNTYITAIEYSPLVGGFAIVLSNGKAAFLTAHSLKFDPNQVQGVWARDIDDATCAAVNHKYRLIAFGRKNSQGLVLYVDETSGSLEVSHNLILSTKDYPGIPGSVSSLRWTPDSCAIAMVWCGGGVAIWSTFGALLLCTLKWDYGLNIDPIQGNPFQIKKMEWSAEGYQLWMLKDSTSLKETYSDNKSFPVCSVVQWEFVKSPLTVNPCMSHHGHIVLQGEDRLYINLGHKIFYINNKIHFSHGEHTDGFCHVLSGTKQWLVVSIPNAYASSNWPIRFTAIDEEGQNVAIAGKTGLAHYSLLSRRWKLFGNEYQEKDFVVTGGLLWYRQYLITSSFSIPKNEDEIRIYPRDVRLDNNYARSIKMTAQILLLNILKNLLLAFCANSQISIYNMVFSGDKGDSNIELVMIQTIDVSSLCPHPACVASASLTLIRSERTDDNVHPETLLLNISGKLLMVQRDHWMDNKDALFTCAAPTVLASSVENLWIPSESKKDKPHLTETVWLFCGAQGMRVWLPLFPKSHLEKIHTFMSKRIMLPFNLKIYPLTILFEDAILLGAENDTVLYTSDTSSPFILPFSILELTSQVYLHQVLRQLIHRNLGYHAWEIARSCSSLPYFSHSLELLLHEVLEDEATSKEPLPDAQLPSIVEFIQEFPGFWTRAIVQCARKTEIALWPYLFSVVGPPKKLLQTCLNHQELDTAASYLLILQNLEASAISRQYATILLDAALDQGKWELSKDLVRFLRAIDPNDIDTSKNSYAITSKIPAQNSDLSSQEEDLTLVLGTMQVSRNRSCSTTITPKLNTEPNSKDNFLVTPVLEKTKNYMKQKKSVPSLYKNEKSKNSDTSAEDFFIDVILQRHARRLLTSQRLYDLGCFAAQLDFHLVIWMARERDRAAKIDDYVSALKAIHDQFAYPYPSSYIQDINKLKGSEDNAMQVFDIPINEDFHKNIRNTTFDNELPDSGYISLPSSRTYYTNYVLAANRLNTHFIRSYEAENIENSNLNDFSSTISDMSTLIWKDDTTPVTENNPDTGCWTLANSSDANEIIPYYLNDYTARADVQLRYLLQLFLEAGCLGWAAIIAVVLRDISAIARTVRAAHAPMQTLESTINLKDGLIKLIDWSHLQCLGYKQFLSSIQGQIELLQQLVVEKQQNQLENHKSNEPDVILENNVLRPTPSYINLVSHSQRTSAASTSNSTPNNDQTLNKLSRINDVNYCGRKIQEDTNTEISNPICTVS